MPGIRLPMPPEFAGCDIVARAASGLLAAQRSALAALIDEAGWAAPTKEETGRPRLGEDHCSLSHGGGWVVAARCARPVGVDVEQASERLHRVRRRFVGPADQPVLDAFGDDLDTLCRLWTAKEAVYKVFGTSVDFLTGIEWQHVNAEGARLTALQHGTPVDLHWKRLGKPGGGAWLAVAAVQPG